MPPFRDRLSLGGCKRTIRDSRVQRGLPLFFTAFPSLQDQPYPASCIPRSCVAVYRDALTSPRRPSEDRAHQEDAAGSPRTRSVRGMFRNASQRLHKACFMQNASSARISAGLAVDAVGEAGCSGPARVRLTVDGKREAASRRAGTCLAHAPAPLSTEEHGVSQSPKVRLPPPPSARPPVHRDMRGIYSECRPSPEQQRHSDPRKN